MSINYVQGQQTANYVYNYIITSL